MKRKYNYHTDIVEEFQKLKEIYFFATSFAYDEKTKQYYCIVAINEKGELEVCA
jgi:hypothetical protein